MPYSTLDGIKGKIPEQELIQLTDDPDPVTGQGAGVVNTTVFDSENAATQNLIDGYLRGRYTLPFATLPPELIDLSDSILIYKLHVHRFRTNVPESLNLQYKRDVEQLVAIQKGVFKLNIEDPASAPAAGGYKTNKTKNDRIFGKDKLDQY